MVGCQVLSVQRENVYFNLWIKSRSLLFEPGVADEFFKV